MKTVKKTRIFWQRLKDFLANALAVVLKIIGYILLGCLCLFIAFGMLLAIAMFIALILSGPVLIINAIFNTSWTTPITLLFNFTQGIGAYLGISGHFGSHGGSTLRPAFSGGIHIMMP